MIPTSAVEVARRVRDAPPLVRAAVVRELVASRFRRVRARRLGLVRPW